MSNNTELTEAEKGIRHSLAKIKEKCPQEHSDLVEHLKSIREFHFGRLRRNIETPNVLEQQYWIITGEMMAHDDIMNVVSDTEPEVEE